MRSSHHHNHHARRLLCLTALACFVAGGAAYACTHKAAVPQLPELSAESLEQPAEYGVQQSTLTAAQAQAILDNATEEANSIRYGAMQYTDDMLAKLQYIIEHSIKDNKEKYDSLLSGLENVLSVVNNNRNELSGIEEGETEETVQNNSEDLDSTDTDNNE